MRMDDIILVSIKCLVYNHEPFLRQCLDGFVMQKTNFRFEAIVHDDASTDDSASIIREYAEKYPDIIKPIFETENQYSKRDGSLTRIIDAACTGKYIAFCEGDDFWTDPYKLQKQIDFLERHQEYMMACNRVKLYSVSRKTYVGEIYCYDHDCQADLRDVVNRSGLFIPTCSIVYRKSLLDDYPEYCSRCVVGDYPLQIYAAVRGKVYYFNDVMSVYRYQNSNSWMSNQAWHSAQDDNLNRVLSMVKMFQGFEKDYPEYNRLFRNKVSQYLRDQMPYVVNDPNGYLKFTRFFKKYLKKSNIFWKIDYYLRGSKLPILRHYYYHSGFFVRKYKLKQIYY